MITRQPFTTENVQKINDLLMEGIAKIEANFADASYPKEKARKITFEIVFEPNKSDPDEIETKLFMEPKFPKRYGKLVKTVMRQGRILVEEGPEDVELFGQNVMPIDRKEGTND
jgi:hypothetical protein